MTNPMNVLLTGGTGYIGSHTLVELLQLGHQVFLYDNLSNSSDNVLKKLSDITGEEVPFIRGDVRDTKLLTSVLTSHNIDVVIHFAGLKVVSESIEKSIDYYANNVQGTISLLQAMQLVQVKSLVFSSSAAVYGEPQYHPVDENHPTAATNPYGRSKLHIEQMLADVAASDPEWQIACLRYFNPVGAHESGLIGEISGGVPNNLMPHIAQVAAGQRAVLSVFGGDYLTPDGTGVRDYIHVEDLAKGHAAALGFLSKTAGWHAINLGTGKGCSVLDLIQAFQEASGRKVPYKIVARRAGDVAACYSDSKKASKVLNWHSVHTLDDMCASAWHFYQAQLSS